MKFAGIYALLILLLSINISCKKYLDKKSSNSLVVPEKLADLQALLDDATNIMNQNVTPSYGQVSTDDYFMLQSTYDLRLEPERDAYRFIPTVYNHPNGWSKGYTPVYNANYCLDMLEEIPKTSQNEAAWNNVKGSALFYRSYNFLNLLWEHGKAYDENTSAGDLGIVLRLHSDFNEPSVRSNVKECYDRIISDTKESVSYLPDNPTHVYRPSKAAAYGLLARAYLSMRKYDDALIYSNLCLQINNFLMDCKVTDPVNFAGSTASFPFRQFNRETIFYSEMTSSFPGPILSTSRAKIDTLLYQSYGPTDIRKTAYFAPSSNYYSFKGSYTQNGVPLFSGIATDEMFLTRAECYARKGDKTAALNDLNTLLAKRHTAAFIPITAADAPEALGKILIERRKELLFRGLRWIDIKRLNEEGYNIIPERLVRLSSGTLQTYKLLPKSNYYALPLPTDIINLTGMPQNPF